MLDIDLDKLIFILDAEYELYQNIYNLAKVKKEVIINREIDQLKEIVKQEEAYLAKTTTLEEKRRKLCNEKPLSEMLDIVDSHYKEKLTSIQDKLLTVFEDLKGINSLNKDLLNISLNLNNMTMNFLTADNKRSTYSKQGMVNSNQGKHTILNHKA
ncbi:flagellar protein FlgN [Orenia marismortui]|uniref:flagellar protein FlgN n=1 Tax=Orenia marismortui TaxID=46469 RepID=UPI00036ED85B|nr:flagellar protein FlgN [Orenia marismortui]